MNHAGLTQLPHKWTEAQRRAETYLRALHGTFGAAERQLLQRVIATARHQHRQQVRTHPVTLVMQTLFDLLPAPVQPVPMTPPIRRVSMLPEPLGFPLHAWLRRCFRRGRFAFAGLN
jgi:hypothetical protein